MVQRLRENDQFQIFGNNVAAKLKGLPKETRLYTEKLINDVLFEAEMGNISKYSNFFTESSICSLSIPYYYLHVPYGQHLPHLLPTYSSQTQSLHLSEEQGPTIPQNINQH